VSIQLAIRDARTIEVPLSFRTGASIIVAWSSSRADPNSVDALEPIQTLRDEPLNTDNATDGRSSAPFFELLSRERK
jgi:hypothetical protein